MRVQPLDDGARPGDDRPGGPDRKPDPGPAPVGPAVHPPPQTPAESPHDPGAAPPGPAVVHPGRTG